MRFGVIGWGLRGPLATLAHRPDEGLRVVALADLDPGIYPKFRERIGSDAKTVADYRDLLEMGLDAIFVLSPDYLHEEHAIACLDAGVSVFLEKPMAITVEGCDRILEAASRSRAKLYVGHNMRHFPVVRTMKSWIEEGLIGEVKTAWCRHFVSYGGDAYFCDWHADRSKSTGLLLQKGAHDIDVLHYLCGGYSERVAAMGSLMVYGDNANHREVPGRAEFRKTWPPATLTNLNPVVDVEDVNLMLMELDNGVLASYQQCHFTPDAWRNYTVIGSEGRIENFGDSPGNATVKLWNSVHYGYEPTADKELAIASLEGTHGGADPKMIDEFIAYIRDGAPTETSPVAARQSVAAGVAATISVRSGGQPQMVAPLPTEALTVKC